VAARQLPGGAGLINQFLTQNPDLNGPQSKFECAAERIVPAGGALAGLLLHDSVVPFEWTFRQLPPAGLFTATRQNPCQVTLGAATVPQQMGLALAEYRFRLYRFDGLVPGEAVPLEDRRQSLTLGNYLAISQFTQRGNTSNQIIPALGRFQENPIFQGMPTGGTVGDGTRPSGGPPTTFPGLIPDPYAIGGTSTVTSTLGGPLNLPFVNTQQFVTAAQGAALMPQSQDPAQGPSRLPFTYYVAENTPVSLQVTAFAPVRVPLAFLEGVLSGYLMSWNALKALMDEVKPCMGR